MKSDQARAEVVLWARKLGLAEIRPDWRGCDAVWEVVEAMAAEGAIVLIKIDGQRQGPGDSGRYTILVSGGPLGEDFFRRDTPVLEDGIALAIVYYAERCWNTL